MAAIQPLPTPEKPSSQPLFLARLNRRSPKPGSSGIGNGREPHRRKSAPPDYSLALHRQAYAGAVKCNPKVMGWVRSPICGGSTGGGSENIWLHVIRPNETNHAPRECGYGSRKMRKNSAPTSENRAEYDEDLVSPLPCYLQIWDVPLHAICKW